MPQTIEERRESLGEKIRRVLRLLDVRISVCLDYHLKHILMFFKEKVTLFFILQITFDWGGMEKQTHHKYCHDYSST